MLFKVIRNAIKRLNDTCYKKDNNGKTIIMDPGLTSVEPLGIGVAPEGARKDRADPRVMRILDRK